MFTPIIRIILVIGNLGMAIFFFLNQDYPSMVLVLLAAFFFVYGYFKYGTVYAAFQQLKKGNLKKAEELIAKIKNPDKLSRGQKSYYHFTKGVIASEKREWENSSSELIKALSIGLRTKNDTSIVLFNLANVEFERENFEKAKEFVLKTNNYDLKPLIKIEIEKLMEKINAAQ
jgi:tetratricopeptide (TPR) repeat protein